MISDLPEMMVAGHKLPHSDKKHSGYISVNKTKTSSRTLLPSLKHLR